MFPTGSPSSHAAAVSPSRSHAASLPPSLRQAVQRAAKRPDSQAPGPHEQALLAALGSYLARRAGADTGQPVDLDLSTLAPDALALFTEPVARQLQLGSNRVTAVLLPGNARSLPADIGALTALQKLVLPGFTGTQLDLRQLLAGRTATHPALWISTPGSKTLREILVPSVRQASQALRFDLRTAHSRKVTLVDEALRRPVPGRAYDREAFGRDAKDQKTRDAAYDRSSSLNLNLKVPFKDISGRIACQHLATAHAFRMIEHRRGPAMAKDGPRPRLDYKAFSRPETLQDAVPSSYDARYKQITMRSRDNHLVALTRWNAFLRSQAGGMAPGQCRQFLVMAENHVMHMELQVKRREEGDVDWVVTLYDPNRTTTHRRAVVDRSGVVPCTLESLLPPGSLAGYFGSDRGAMTALVVTIPEDPFSGGQQHDTKGLRADITYAGEHCTTQEVFHRLQNNLTDGLGPRLEQALETAMKSAGEGELLTLLQVKDTNGTPALFIALCYGHAQAAQALLETPLKAASEGRISQDGLLALLQAKDAHGTPALFMALQFGHAQAAQALLDTALKAASEDLIKQGELLALLQANDPDGTPALFMALQIGHAQAAQALLETAMKAASEGRISNGELLALLQAEDPDGTPALLIALEDGNAQAAQALLETAMKAASEGRISNGELLALLQANDTDGTPALFMALQNGQAQAAQALLDTALKAASEERINQGELLDLLQANDADGIPALYTALEHGHAQAAQALLDTALKAASEGRISQDGLLALLQAKHTDGTAAVAMALRNGHAQAAQALLNVLPSQALEWLRDAGMALQTAALSPAPAPAGSLSANVGVWVEAVLNSPLPPSEKVALLLPPSAGSGLLAYLATSPDLAAQHRGKLRTLLDTLVPRAGDHKAHAAARAAAHPLQALNRAFMAANLHGWVEELAQCLAASKMPPQACADILLASDSFGESALSVAMDRGNTLAVQAWTRAALALTLEPAAKKALLVGQAASGPSAGVPARPGERSTRLAWAECIARATADQLSYADKQALLEDAQMSHLLPPPVRIWAAPKRRPGHKAQPAALK